MMQRDLALLASREHDLAIVGGGIHGAAAAWDAAQRGLTVALLERDDFAAGVSANSLKTIHGGLRYLQRADLASLRESVRERRALLRIAPALVRPLPFLVPTYGHGLLGREALGAALFLNDLLSRDRNEGLPETHRIPRARMLSRREVRERLPGVAAQGLTGAGLWFDGQVGSGERLALAFVHAAVEAGAAAANHVEAARLSKTGDRIAGVVVREGATGREHEVRARVVLNAAGAGAAGLLASAGIAGRPVPLVRAWNLVFKVPPATPFAVGARSGGRFLFLVPWRDRTMVGTAYGPVETSRAEAVAAFRAEAVRAFPWAGLEGAPLALVHEGLLPGRVGEAGLAAHAHLRDHEAQDGVPGLVSLQGVKYTTARAVAERAVDLVFRRLGRSAPPCRTATTALRHARPLEGTLEERTRAAVRDEMALTLEDAVLRRLDLGTVGRPAPAELSTVVRTMAGLLGWEPARQDAEEAALANRFPPA